MKSSGMVADLHVHSKFSKRPSQWFLQKIGCPESFTEPKKIYSIAKSRGMDLVTITDHNTLAGSLEIGHLEDTFLSEEITTYFPEDGCKIHVLALDISESIHEDITRLRKNIYDLTGYLRSEGIRHILAHPLYDMNNKLSFDHFERLLLMFQHFEMNVSRDCYQNKILKSVLENLTADEIWRLAEKHGLEPVGTRPWIKTITGGSDDHSSLNIARACTFVPGARTKDTYLQGLDTSTAQARMLEATPKTMAHNLYGIAYQFYKSKFKLESCVAKSMMLRFADGVLTVPEDERRLWRKLQEFLSSRKPFFPSFKSESDALTSVIQDKAQSIIAANPDLQNLLNKAEQIPGTVEEEWFSFVNEVADEVLRYFADSILRDLSQANPFKIFQALGSAGTLYTLLAPYFLSFRLFVKDRRLAETCFRKYGKQAGQETQPPTRIALFSDTFHEVNGVALTLQMQLDIARKNHKELQVLTCCQQTDPQGTVNFEPIGECDLSIYPGLKLNYPPFLKMLEYCYQHNFTQIQNSTPGPMGLAALGIARILELPIYGTYHTDLPQYAAKLTGDFEMEEMMWRFVVWYYNQMDGVYVPSRFTGEELVKRGVLQEKIRCYPRGIDIEHFHPHKRNGFWQRRFHLKKDVLKLIYVGRISKEKGLDTLASAYKDLLLRNQNCHLIIVGDGPYLETLQQDLAGTPALFTGPLFGEDLAQAYASSDAFVFPSSTDTFGNVVLEAQASGLPVIVTDQGGPQENLLLEKTGLIVPADNSSALATAMLYLLNHPDLLQSMQQEARIYMENRSFESCFMQSWDLYSSAALKTPAENAPAREVHV